MRLRWHTFFILAPFLVLCKIFLGANIEIANSSPDLFLLLLTYIALSVQEHEALVAGWLLGLFLDITSAQPFGFYAFLYLLTTFLILKLKEEAFIDHPLFCCSIAFILTLQWNLLRAILIFFLYGKEYLNVYILCGTNFFLVALLGAVYTFCISPLFLWIFKSVDLVFSCTTS